MYVQAVVQQATARDMVLAPQEGVTRDRRGQPIALVVNADNVVEQRQLTILQDMGNHWIVSEGLADGDRIVVEGLQKIGPGMTVTPEERQTATAGAAEGAAAADDAPPAPAESAEEQPAQDAGTEEQPTQSDQPEAQPDAAGDSTDTATETDAGSEQPAN